MTDGGLNAILRVDPATRAVRAFPLPEGPGNVNLNTASFDRAGVLWFTGQSEVWAPESGSDHITVFRTR